MKTSVSRKLRVAGLALLAGSAVAMATITFDASTGAGFVGKGDVQYTFGLNNKGIQDLAGMIAFRGYSSVESHVDWECTNNKNEKVQERESTTVTVTEGLISSVDRTRTQITGFILAGWSGSPTTTTVVSGKVVNSCPGDPTQPWTPADPMWTLTTPAGDPVVVSSESYLQVSKDAGSTWTRLLQAL